MATFTIKRRVETVETVEVGLPAYSKDDFASDNGQYRRCAYKQVGPGGGVYEVVLEYHDGALVSVELTTWPLKEGEADENDLGLTPESASGPAQFFAALATARGFLVRLEDDEA